MAVSAESVIIRSLSLILSNAVKSPADCYLFRTEYRCYVSESYANVMLHEDVVYIFISNVGSCDPFVYITS